MSTVRRLTLAFFALVAVGRAAIAQEALIAYQQLPKAQNEAIATIDLAVRDGVICGLAPDAAALAAAYRAKLLRDGAGTSEADHFLKVALGYFRFARSVEPETRPNPAACPPSARVDVEVLLARLAVGDFTHRE